MTASKNIETTVSAELAGRLDRLVCALTEKSRNEVRGLLAAGCVRVEGRTCKRGGEIVPAGARLEITYDAQTRYREPPPPRKGDRAFQLVHEDEDLLIVDKAAFVLSVPTDDGGETNTLVHRVSRYLQQTSRRRNARAFAIHRLDKGTSGLLVFAKSHLIASQLQEQFRGHKPEREYVVLASGTFSPAAGTIESRLATTKSLQRYSSRNPSEGERAVTHYQMQESFGSACLVRAQLETGRRNQIRVHFSEAGHPVLGDQRYRPDRARHFLWTANRLALHAAILGFRHPRTDKPVRFESPLPIEFDRFLKAMRARQQR